jgi:hypothetical protein
MRRVAEYQQRRQSTIKSVKQGFAMQLIEEIKGAMNGCAGRITTKAIQNAMELLALRYANATGLAFGGHTNLHAESINVNGTKTLCVQRNGAPIFKDCTSRGFLYNHCWLVFYNAKEKTSFSNTEEPLAGYLIGCELVMESELAREGEPGTHGNNEWHRDFQKLVIAKAPYKVFIFKSFDPERAKDTFARLETQIFCTSMHQGAETYLLSCWCNGAFAHRVFSVSPT